jgi:hypothetical protein
MDLSFSLKGINQDAKGILQVHFPADMQNITQASYLGKAIFGI